MSFIISGDTHGTLDIGKIIKFFEENEGNFNEDDYLIICGDVGVCGFSGSDEAKVREVYRNFPVTTLFVDGNHENFEHLNAYEIDYWCGGKVHFIESRLIHLMRGQVFEFNGARFFTFGGAYSIDRKYRIPGVSWFSEEIPTIEEYNEGWENLKRVDFQVDYILSHNGPSEVVAAMGFGEISDEEVEMRKYLQSVADNTEFTAWYFGHYHEDVCVEDMFYCLYDELIVID